MDAKVTGQLNDGLARLPTIRTAPSRNSGSYLLRGCGMTGPHKSCLHRSGGSPATRGTATGLVPHAGRVSRATSERALGASESSLHHVISITRLRSCGKVHGGRKARSQLRPFLAPQPDTCLSSRGTPGGGVGAKFGHAASGGFCDHRVALAGARCAGRSAPGLAITAEGPGADR